MKDIRCPYTDSSTEYGGTALKKENIFRNTVRGQHIRDLCAVFLFLLLFPYCCSLVLGKDFVKETELFQSEAGQEIRIRVRQKNGTRLLELEEYLIGALAASIPADYEMETLKAQAVILRTMCVRENENQHTEGGFVDMSAVGQQFFSSKQMQKEWRKDAQDHLNKIKMAVQETAGIYMTHSGKVIEPGFFYLSAGKTRSGEEVLGKAYSYFAGVDCPEDRQEKNAAGSFRMTEEQFRRRLGLAKEKEISLIRDSSDYVLWVKIGERCISGEEFRNLLGLDSACFSLHFEKNTVIVSWKGIGHGLGFCQYDANRRAKEGMNFTDLLNLYFHGIELQKMYE